MILKFLKLPDFVLLKNSLFMKDCFKKGNPLPIGIYQLLSKIRVSTFPWNVLCIYIKIVLSKVKIHQYTYIHTYIYIYIYNRSL